MDQRGEPRPQEASRPAPQRDDHPGDGAASAVLSLALATVRELSHLAGAELRLAADSALRMALLFIAALLLAALAWLALAGLVAALAYQYLGSPVPAIAAFLKRIHTRNTLLLYAYVSENEVPDEASFMMQRPQDLKAITSEHGPACPSKF